MIYFVSNQTSIGESEYYQRATISEFFDWLKNQKEVQIDTETTGFDAYTHNIICAQFGNDDYQWVITEDIIFSQNSKAQLKPILESMEILCILQNALFDLRFFYIQGIYPRRIYDTFIAEICINLGYDAGTYRRSLQALAEKYLGIYINKEIRGQIHYKGLSDDVIVYAANDVKYLNKIKHEQEKIIAEKELETIVNLENSFVRVLTYLTLSGISLNIEKWTEKCAKDKQELAELEKRLHDCILEHPNQFRKYINNQLDLFSDELTTNINFSSPAQVVKLFKELGLNLETKDKKTGKIKDSVEANILIPQKDKHPLIPIYLDFKSQEKTVSTYGENWLKHINAKSGRLHTQYTQMLDTGRMSSGGKDKYNKIEYLNFLNIPQDNEIRNCIIPKEGYSFIDCDFTGQETMIFAEFSQEPSMVEFLNSDGSDMHSFIASKIYPELSGVPLDEIKTKHKQARQSAKAAGFAIQYGGVGATIAKNLSISTEEGEFVYNSYMKAFPKISEYFKKCKAQVLSKGFIVTNQLTKRRIHFTDFEKYKELSKEITGKFWEEYREQKKLNSFKFSLMKETIREYFLIKGKLERASLNYPIQSTGADMTKLAAMYLFNHIIETDNMFKVFIPLVVHDQIVVECPDSETEYWAKITSDCMVKAGDLFCKSVKIKAEPEILKKWKK
jgi:DNA polymerase-1